MGFKRGRGQAEWSHNSQRCEKHRSLAYATYPKMSLRQRYTRRVHLRATTTLTDHLIASGEPFCYETKNTKPQNIHNQVKLSHSIAVYTRLSALQTGVKECSQLIAQHAAEGSKSLGTWEYVAVPLDATSPKQRLPARDPRSEARMPAIHRVQLSSLDQPTITEPTTTQNLSSRGARVMTQRIWEPGSRLLMRSRQSDFWAQARVVYWRSFSGSRFAIGLEFVASAGKWPTQY